jgi:hypothetical protein
VASFGNEAVVVASRNNYEVKVNGESRGYGVEPFQVVGIPNSLAAKRCQIDAKADAAANRDQMHRRSGNWHGAARRRHLVI